MGFLSLRAEGEVREMQQKGSERFESMRSICLIVAGLGNVGDHVKRNMYDLRELMVSKEAETLGHNCKELDFANNLNELESGLFPRGSRKKCSPADTLSWALLRP